MNAPTPKVTVFLACRSGLGEARPQLVNLSEQTMSRDLEVLLLAPAGQIDPGDLRQFGELHVRLLEAGEVRNRGRSAAEGVMEARAPFFMMVENHSFLEPHAIETIHRAWRETDGALAPVVRAANPELLRSLSMFTLTYAQSSAPADDRPRPALPFHNAMFRTDVLRDFGEELSGLLADEAVLQEKIRNAGYDLRLIPAGQAWHINEARLLRGITDPFALSFRFGRSRASHWNWPRRVLYAFASPLIAGVQFIHLAGQGYRAEDVRKRLIPLLPLLGMASLSMALGEACAYLGLRPGGEEDSPYWRDFETHEFHIRGRTAGTLPREPRVRRLLSLAAEDVL